MVSKKPPKLKDQPRPFFLDALQKRMLIEGGHRALAQAITRAYKSNMVHPQTYQDRSEFIDRRKLKRLLEHDREVVLSIVELESLHAYLDAHAIGLTRRPFFTHSSIVQELADMQDVAFMLGTRMSQEGPELSHWDIQAMARIQRTVNEYSATTFDIIDVPRSPPKRSRSPEWAKMFGDDSLHSVVTIGSERSNTGTLRALRSMLHLAPAKTPKWDTLPFYFVLYGASEGRRTKDSLSRPVASVMKVHEELGKRVSAGEGWGLVVGDRTFLSQAATRRATAKSTRTLQERVVSHGVIAAQRQPGGQIWVAVAGLTGPGTLAAASQLSAMSGVLPQASDEQPNAILWGVVESVVDTTPMSLLGRPPVMEPSRFVVSPSLWDPEKRRPIR